MLKITNEQVNQIMKLVYDLNCPAPAWETLKKMLAELPAVEEPKKEEETK